MCQCAGVPGAASFSASTGAPSSEGCHNAFFISARLPAEAQLHDTRMIPAAVPDTSTHGCMHHKSLPGTGQTDRLPELQA
jgi:hypothetical protein